MPGNSYDPTQVKLLTFHDQVAAFKAGSSSPVQYLRKCLDTIDTCEPTVKAWVTTRFDEALREAEESTRRYREGATLSPIDGIPIGLKDLILTKDLPTWFGIKGNKAPSSNIDSACVQALRAAGALILGKLTTTELGGGDPSETTNPFDPGHSPGGSSSGSGAAVGAGMLPVAIGTQVGGSVIRPASFCGNYALKPTYGALNRGERQGYSQSALGVHAGCLEDMWLVTAEIGIRAGGDPGSPGLYGRPEVPPAMQPHTLIALETAGWARADPKSKEVFEQIHQQLLDRGVRVMRRSDDPAIEALELSLQNLSAAISYILAFENRWQLENLERQFPGMLSKGTLGQLALARTVSLEQYRDALSRRDESQLRLAKLQHLADGLVTLSALGPAVPLGIGFARAGWADALPTGDPVFNLPSSALGMPTITLPLAAVRGLPLGIQLMGQPHTDERLTAIARWIDQHLERVKVN